MTDRDRFEALAEQLEVLVDAAREAGIVVCDFQPQVTWQHKINFLVQRMHEVDKLKGAMQDVHVPVQVFDSIDQAKNPNLFTRQCMESALRRNEEVKGRIESLRRFRALLMAQLSLEFPNEMAKYRTVRGDPQSPPDS